MKAAELSEQRRGDKEQRAAGEHLRARAHGFGPGERHPAAEQRCHRPAYGSDDQGQGAGVVDGGFAAGRLLSERRISDQNGHARDPDKKRKGESQGQPLGPQKKDLAESHEHRSGGQHDGGDA